ncbi:hypothetical protein GCM10010517_33840 [Streptosporangium fragile]|uniref:Short-chain dehydrogenase n=1 Tax=Streptosporangium fragile TaxID=46186 RepID=A0ABP6IDM0_9ACTN
MVTGASRGIGLAIARAFADEGAAVAICARDGAALRAAEEELLAKGVAVHASVCDVADPAALTAFLDAAGTELGRVDVLVNNAGALVDGDDDPDWERAFAVDLMAAVRASRHVAPMLASPRASWISGALLRVDGGQLKTL